MKQKVLQWINDNFYMSLITLEDYPLFPGGTIITDRNNEKMLVYYDIIDSIVKYEFI